MKNDKAKNGKTNGGMPSIKSRIDMLVKRLKASDDEIFLDAALANPERAEIVDKPGRYVFIDNGASVLAVAHVDTVAGYGVTYRYPSGGDFYENWQKDENGVYQPIPGKVVKAVVDNNAVNIDDRWVNSIKLDDRLGVHIILDLLPMLGINVDVLLTDDEESAMSTAQYFEPPDGKVYNWAFAFDRRGVGECVMYQYDRAPGVKKLLDKAGWYLGHGTYSDIADLDIGCVCFNFAAGYWDEHTSKCVTHYDNVMVNARMFAKFFRQNKDTHMPFTQPVYGKRWGGNYYSWHDYDDYTGASSTRGTVWRASTDPRNTPAPVTIRPGGDIECWYCGAPATVYTKNYTPLCDNCNCEDVTNERLADQPPEEGTTCIYCGANEATRWDDYSGDPQPICEDCWRRYVAVDYKDGRDELDAAAALSSEENYIECNNCGIPTPESDLDAEFPLACKTCAEYLRRHYRDDELETMDWLMKSQDYTRRTYPLLSSGNGG